MDLYKTFVMLLPLVLLLVAHGEAFLTFGDYCLDASGQLKKFANHPGMYFWNVHENDMLMTCPPTTIWHQDECACMTIEEIQEENPDKIKEMKARIEAALAAAPEPTEPGMSDATMKLLLNFDNGAIDDDSKNHAYIQRRKNVRVTRRGEGVKGNAAKFRSGYLKIPMFNNFLWGNDFTLSLWIKPDLSQPGFYGIIDDAAVACLLPSSLFLEIGRQSDSGIEIYAGLRTHLKLATLISYLPIEMVDNRWIHICLVYDGEIAEMYINGKLRAKENVFGDVLSRPCPLTIGYSRGLRRTKKYQGLMDQVYIIKYVATKEEIRELFVTKKKLKSSTGKE